MSLEESATELSTLWYTMTNVHLLLFIFSVKMYHSVTTLTPADGFNIQSDWPVATQPQTQQAVVLKPIDHGHHSIFSHADVCPPRH